MAGLLDYMNNIVFSESRLKAACFDGSLVIFTLAKLCDGERQFYCGL